MRPLKMLFTTLLLLLYQARSRRLRQRRGFPHGQSPDIQIERSLCLDPNNNTRWG
jgi:hypothetical protein